MIEKDCFQVQALQDFLRGPWRVEREILDRRAGLNGSFVGSVSFAPEGGGLRYREQGRIALGDYSGRAHRDGFYRFPAPHRAEVSFGDGRPFHDLDLRTGHWSAVHCCPPDRYEGRFAACGEDRWLVVWEIAGPCKAARLRSIYLRGPAIRGAADRQPESGSE